MAEMETQSQEKERESQRQRREWFGEHLLHPTLCIKPFCLLLIRCPHGTVLLDMVRVDHMAVGMDVDVAAGVEMPRTFGSARRAKWPFGDVARKC